MSAAGWGADDKFFIEQFAYNAESDTLSAYLGQYPGSCKDNEQWFANVYLIYGEKAYLIKYTLKVMEKESGNGLADYTKKGEGGATVEQEPTSGYETIAIHPDMEAIAAALGCEVGSISMYALDDKDNFAGSTANNGGFWFSNSGTVVAWGSSAAFFVEPPTANDYTTLNVGQFPDVLSVGDEVSANLYFINGENYFTYTVTLKVVEPQHVDFNFESVTTRTFNAQQLLDNSYAMGSLGSISVEDIENLIGTSAPVLYGLNIDSVAVESGMYSKKWSCTPYPGFWLNEEGRVSVWGDSHAVMGIVYSDGQFNGCQYPNRCSVGTTFQTQLFLVNEETGKMITFNINIAFVESIQEQEIVGEETVVIPVSTDNKDVEINAAKAAELLGVTVDDLFNDDNYYWRGLTSGGVYGDGQSASGGMSFGLDGGFDLYGDIYVYPTNNGDNVVLSVFSNTEVAEDFSANAQICIEVGDKQYVIYAKLLSEALYAGITSIKSDSRNAGKVYDLSGREVKQPARGLYIKDGKKVVF